MKPLGGDPTILLRAHGRCGALALELDRLDRALGTGHGSALGRWSGAGAAAFAQAATGHRKTVGGVRAAVERIGVITRAFAYELADAQADARRLPEQAVGERAALEERVDLSRRRFRQQLALIETDLESDLGRLRIGAPTGSDRWTGPVRPPADGPKSQPVDDRWTGPVRLPDCWHKGRRDRRFLRSPRLPPLPRPVEWPTTDARSPWRPRWLNGAGGNEQQMTVQPVSLAA